MCYTFEGSFHPFFFRLLHLTMKFTELTGATVFLGGLRVASASTCKCVCYSFWIPSIVSDPYQAPTDTCWPSASAWSALNSSVSGRLIRNTPPAIICYPDPQVNLPACSEILVALTNSTLIANNPIALDYPINNTCPAIDYTAGEIPGSCTLGSSPVYSIDSISPADVAAGVNFARSNKIRLVVRNTGHDILGR